MTRSARVRVLILLVATIAVLTLVFWARAKRSAVESGTARINRNEPATEAVSENPSPPSSSPTLSPGFTVAPGPSPEQPPASPAPGGPTVAGTLAVDSNQVAKDPTLAGSFVGTLKLVIPVVGVRADQLQDTFTGARSEGRVHDAIDILAPAGTPVVAVTEGEIIKLFQSERGGTTIYQLSPDKKLVFYYAHLQRYADGVVVGKFVRQGEVIAYVGDTGNAGAGNYHLHFSISVVADPKRYWEGTNINPYPLLRR